MKTFTDSLLDSYQKNPDKVIIYLLKSGIQDLPISYKDLIMGSAKFTAELVRKGIKPGEVVILVLQHGIELVYAYFGCVLHGAIPSIMPFLTEKLIPDRYRNDLTSLIKITKPTAIITYIDFKSEIEAAILEKSSVRDVIVVEEIENCDGLPNFQGGFRDENDIVLLQHSSGTTGLQKGVALSHRAVFNQLASYQKAIRLNYDDVIVSWLPLYHDMGLIACFLMPILQQIPLVLMSPFEWVRAPYKLFASVSKYHGTLCWLPNFAYNFCADKIRDNQLEIINLSSLRAVINCSEPVRWESHQKFIGRFEKYGLKPGALTACYAMAENVFAVTQSGINDPMKIDEIDRDDFFQFKTANQSLKNREILKMVSNGRPIENTQIKIISEKGNDLPERHVGQVLIKSNCLLTEYYNRPEETENSFLDGWFKTGDLGYIADGELYINGRIKEMIIVGGKNIYPQDIEYITMNVEGVRSGRVVAFGVYNEKLGTEEVVVVAEVEIERLKDKEKIGERIRSEIAQNSAISLKDAYIVKPKWLIKTSSGKIARGANREKYLKELDEINKK
jgi:fatty-acyl-CoA synthase